MTFEMMSLLWFAIIHSKGIDDYETDWKDPADCAGDSKAKDWFGHPA